MFPFLFNSSISIVFEKHIAWKSFKGDILTDLLLCIDGVHKEKKVKFPNNPCNFIIPLLS